MGASVVGVDQVGIPGPEHRTDPARGSEVPIASHAHGGDGDASGSEASNQGRVRRRDDERLVTLLTLSTREEIHLPLATAPFSAGVQMQHAQRCGVGHARRMRLVASARNAPAGRHVN